MEFDIDDQIRLMASVIASTLPRNRPLEEVAKNAVDLAAAIHDEVTRWEWDFVFPRERRQP
jgi:hypothetical protein